ncbi:hypothetical protein CKAH01_15569 [Colletotrichum kahawae]|uniref:Uncharacterized protein n=1 Tax=Colletotrichum kahawae TaxID=34407 RepID=A0AAD9YI18_COLKA|nr:hypothetical protein CKAH01_15569 [Colletotrichum kahawae]
MVKVDFNPEECLADIRIKVQEVADEELKRIAKERGQKQPASPVTPVEALRAAINSDMPPLDPTTAQAFRFDRAYLVQDKFALLDLYRVLMHTLNLHPADMQKWIEKDTMLARLNSLQKKHATASDTPTDLTAKLDWFREHKYVFDGIGTDEDQAAVNAAFMAAPAGSELAEVSKEVAGWDKLMGDDMDARAEKGEYIAYILTRPHIDNKIIMFYSYTDQGPPDEVKTMRADEKGVMSIVRVGQTYAEAVASAEKEYLEAQEHKKKREAEEQQRDQVSDWMDLD